MYSILPSGAVQRRTRAWLWRTCSDYNNGVGGSVGPCNLRQKVVGISVKSYLRYRVMRINGMWDSIQQKWSLRVRHSASGTVSPRKHLRWFPCCDSANIAGEENDDSANIRKKRTVHEATRSHTK